MKNIIACILLASMSLLTAGAARPVLSVADMSTVGEVAAGDCGGANTATEDIVIAYPEWHNVEFSGKLAADKLPLKPTIKIYMVRDSLIQLSARVPLMGEVARVTMTPRHLEIVNRYKKTYCEENADGMNDLYPSGLSDLQSFLLARAVVLGQGEVHGEVADMADVHRMDNGNIILVPRTEPGLVPFSYGYLLSPSLRTLATLVNIAGKASLELQYTYEDRGMRIDALYDNMKGKSYNVQLDFNTVRWGGREMQPVRTSGYTKLSLKEFIKNLM